MELFLNVVWLSASLAMILLWVYAVRCGYTKHTWNAFIALVLLLVLLFPVISMTDDLVAMDSSSTEMEHVVRRSEMPLVLLHYDISTLPNIEIFAALLSFCLAVLFTRLSRFALRIPLRKQINGFLRVTGVRPPPTASAIA